HPVRRHDAALQLRHGGRGRLHRGRRGQGAGQGPAHRRQYVGGLHLPGLRCHGRRHPGGNVKTKGPPLCGPKPERGTCCVHMVEIVSFARSQTLNYTVHDQRFLTEKERSGALRPARKKRGTIMLTLDNIYRAAFVLRDVARRTDLIEAPPLSRDGGQLYLEPENLQVTVSFKVRGAYYKISQLSPEERAKGVIACSAGNHAQGVALAATRMGIRSIVCMPDGAPIMKVENTKNLGAEVCLVPGTYDDAHDYAVSLQAETGMTFIHPYDDELVIAGQGTIGLEILDQLPDLDAVIVP